MVAVLALAFTIFTAKAQSQAPQGEDLTRAFVGELRLLRVAIENLASSNSRVQILSMRASQHEQRLSSVSTQLLAMRTQLAELTAQTASETAILEQLQERIRLEPDPKLRQQYEIEQQAMKMGFNRSRLKQAALQAEVEQLTQEKLAEESRLREIQQRLDDVERLLAQPRQ
jgi:hypothetical protein